jgi:hypothetical protein
VPIPFVNTFKTFKIITEHLILNVYIVVNPLDMLCVTFFIFFPAYQK